MSNKPFKAISFTPAQVIQYFETRLFSVLPHGELPHANCNGEINVRCVIHQDNNPSMSINPELGVWNCHALCGGGGIIQHEMLLTGCEYEEARDEVFKLLGISPDQKMGVWKFVYTTEEGQPLHWVKRLETIGGRKEITQGYFDQNGNEIPGLPSGFEKVLYRLPAVLEANTIFYVEGEKKADLLEKTLADDGITDVAVTTHAGGAKAWKCSSYATALQGKKVVIFPDNDQEGFSLARNIATDISQIAEEIKIVEIPLPDEHADIEDWINQQKAQDPTKLPERLTELIGTARVPDLFDFSKWNGKNTLAKKRGAKSQTEMLVHIAERHCELFRDNQGIPYAALNENGYRRVLAIEQRKFKHWLTRAYQTATGLIAGAEHLSNAVNALAAAANQVQPVYKRVANISSTEGETILIDLGDEEGNVVALSPSGWQLGKSRSINFRRTDTMAKMPIPLKGGSVNDLKEFLNYDSEDHFVMSVAWVVAALRGLKPFPVLGITGPQGSGKSSINEVLHRLVDPSHCNLRTLPLDARNLAVAASGTYALSFSNVSYVSPEASDALCRLAKGEGFSTRKLHTDSEEFVFSGSCPVSMDGIENFIDKGDLLDRALLVNLQPIKPDARKEEKTFWESFEAKWPYLFGALLDVMVIGLKRLPTTKLKELPRMADMARWITACEVGLGWPDGTFMEVHRASQSAGHEVAFASSIVAQAVYEWLASRPDQQWEGTATELYAEFERDEFKKFLDHKQWPKTANALGGKLTRDIPTLAAKGIKIGQKRTKHRRGWIIARQPEPPLQVTEVTTVTTKLVPYLEYPKKEESGSETISVMESGKQNESTKNAVTVVTSSHEPAQSLEGMGEGVLNDQYDGHFAITHETKIDFSKLPVRHDEWTRAQLLAHPAYKERR